MEGGAPQGSCTISPRPGDQSVSETASMLFVVYNIRDGLTQNGNYYVHTLCLPDIIAHDQIYQALPHHICKLQAIKDWRWEWPGNEATSLHCRTNGVMCTSVKVLC